MVTREQTGFQPHFEIERRFLVEDDDVWYQAPDSYHIIQAYSFERDGFTSRIRLIQEADSFGEWATVAATAGLKGPRVSATRRMHEVPLTDLELAEDVVKRSPYVVEKTRYPIANLDGNPWVFDVFEGENTGLVIAEIEGGNADSLLALPLPPWATKDVTSRQWYNNEWLALFPMRGRWKDGSEFRRRMIEESETLGEFESDDPFL